MGNPNFDPETALHLYRAVLYGMAYIFAGAAIIALFVYVLLLCSEIFFRQPRSKTRRARPPKWASRIPVVEGTLHLSDYETPSLAAPGDLGKEAVRLETSPGCAPM